MTGTPLPSPPRPFDPPGSSSIPPAPSAAEPDLVNNALRTMAARLSGPGWLATVGSALLLLASVVVVAGNWESISPIARFAGLVGSLFTIGFAAEAAREKITSTATALAVLAACLVAPVGIAAAAALSAPWPVCVVVGGLLALLAAEAQSRRWSVWSLKAATAVAAGLAATGLAALLDVPVGLLGAAAAMIALAVGAQRRSVALAVAVAVVPLLDLLADAGIGPGTLERIGATSAVAWWTVPLSTAVAAAVVAVTAHRRCSSVLSAASVAIAGWGSAFGLAAANASSQTWLLVLPASVLAIEVTATIGDRSIFGQWANRLSCVFTPLLALIGTTLPALTLAAVGISRFAGDSSLREWLLPVAATAVALGVATALTRRRPFDQRPPSSAAHQMNRWMHDLLPLGAAGSAVAFAGFADASHFWFAVVALGSWTVSSALTSWSRWIPVTVVHAVWAAAAVTSAPDIATWVAILMIIAAAAMVTLACWCTTSTPAQFAGIPSAVLIGATLIGFQAPDDVLTTAALIGVLALAATARSMASARFGPIDALAVSFGSAACLLALVTTPAAMSLGVLLVAAQIWLYGAASDRVDVASGGAALAAAALISSWWTTGANDLIIAWLAPYGIGGQDIALAAVSVALLIGGVALRATRRPSSWLAYAPGLGTATSWLLMSQPDAQGSWATIAALTIGVGAIALGGHARLGAPLMLGTVAVVGTVLISAGPRLAEAPTWTWIASGGVLLLVLAALIERSERPVLRSGGIDHPSSLVDVFRQEFE